MVPSGRPVPHRQAFERTLHCMVLMKRQDMRLIPNTHQQFIGFVSAKTENENEEFDGKLIG